MFSTLDSFTVKAYAGVGVAGGAVGGAGVGVSAGAAGASGAGVLVGRRTFVAVGTGAGV